MQSVSDGSNVEIGSSEFQMKSRLINLPYELLSYIVEYIRFVDTINLARTCKRLQFLEREENISKKVVEEKLAFCDEVINARKAGCGYAAALRRVAKRHEALATASPFSVAVVGFADHFLYCRGNLCYILDDILRILDLHHSRHDEVVVSIQELRRNFLPVSDQSNSGRFQVLYCNENIVSCLYTSNVPDSLPLLIAFDTQKRRIVFTHELLSTERIFVRNDSEFLYYGTFSGENFLGHKKWLLHGYCFRDADWLQKRILLGYLNGAEIGSSICFEIYNGYFYALSNQTNYDVEEVDWSSFYHCVRFPLDSPCRNLLEKTALDESMWRRQHREGPLDDRWTSLALKMDETTGDLKIVETRREFLFGAGRSQRTYYTTDLIFPQPSANEIGDSPLNASGSTNSHSAVFTSASLDFDETSSNDTFPTRHTLAALTNDRLALTLKPSDNAHWLPPQTRFPQNVHPGHDGHYIFSKTHLRYYNSSAETFLDLVDDPKPTDTVAQRLRLRVGSRKLDPPARDCNGIIIQEAFDPATDEILYGLNDRYTSRPVTFWPPERDPSEPEYGLLEELYTLMNPPSHLGNVEVMGDDKSFVYATGGKGEPRAILFVNFDPAIRLRGMRSWETEKRNLQGAQQLPERQPEAHNLEPNSGTTKGKNTQNERAIDESWEWNGQAMPNVETSTEDLNFNYNANDGGAFPQWIWSAPAMFTSINRGFDLGL